MADQSRGSLRDAIIGRRLKSIGYALYALAVCVWAYDGWYIHNANQGGRAFSLGEGGLYFVAFGALIFLGGFLVFKGQQYLARSESADRLVNSGPPVVLLRPFESDATVLGTGKWFGGGEGFYTLTPFTGKYFIEQNLAEASTSCATSSVSMSIRPPMPSSSRSMRRAKSRRLTAPSPVCR